VVFFWTTCRPARGSLRVWWLGLDVLVAVKKGGTNWFVFENWRECTCFCFCETRRGAEAFFVEVFINDVFVLCQQTHEQLERLCRQIVRSLWVWVFV